MEVPADHSTPYSRSSQSSIQCGSQPAARVMTKSGKGSSDRPAKGGKNEGEEGDEEESTLYSFLAEKLNKFFIDHIPVESVQELPPGCESAPILIISILLTC